MRTTRSFLVALALMVPLATLGASPAKASASVSLGFFYDSLAPHGNWYASAEFGYVWRPAHVSVGWRPYVDGRWAYSEVGWTFVSNDSWGWAAYHYGRWYYDPYHGWVWVPGYEWAPAWVTFYEGPGWVGWAPLPPRVSIGVSYASPIRIDPRAYCFVESRYFLDPYVGRRIQPVARNTTLVRSVRDVTRFERVRGVAVNRGLAVDRIERATRAKVRTFRLVDQTTLARHPRSELRGDALTVFRPKVDQRAARPPKVSPGRPARFDSRADRPSVSSPARKLDVERQGPPARAERPAATRSSTSLSSRSERSSSTARKLALPERKPTTTRSLPTAPSRSRVESVAPRARASDQRAVAPGRTDVRRAAPSTQKPGQRWTTDTRQPSAGARTQPEPKADPRNSKAAPAPTKKSTANAKVRGGKPTASKPSERKPPRLG